jgi:hypothetical protein
MIRFTRSDSQSGGTDVPDIIAHEPIDRQLHQVRFTILSVSMPIDKRAKIALTNIFYGSDDC